MSLQDLAARCSMDRQLLGLFAFDARAHGNVVCSLVLSEGAITTALREYNRDDAQDAIVDMAIATLAALHDLGEAQWEGWRSELAIKPPMFCTADEMTSVLREHIRSVARAQSASDARHALELVWLALVELKSRFARWTCTLAEEVEHELALHDFERGQAEMVRVSEAAQ